MNRLQRGAIIRHYVETALWSTLYLGDLPDDEDTPENVDDIADIDDCSPAMLQTMRDQCAAFLWEARRMLHPFIRRDGLVNTLARAGHDLWLTAQGHGAGFWDGDWSIPAGGLIGQPDEDIDAGNELSDLARTHGERGSLYVSGDYDACMVSIA